MSDAARSSARLGLTLRSVLVAPRDGFEAAFRTAERRSRAGVKPAEGTAPYVLAAGGGAAVMSLGLKLGGLLGAREVSSSDFAWPYLLGALLLGAAVGVAAGWLWGLFGPRAMTLLGVALTARDLRTVWGAAAFPQVIGLLFLLPLDLLVVGPATYTTVRLEDSLSTAWAAGSIAIALGLAVWSVLLLVRGIEVAGKASTIRGVAGAALAGICLVVVVALLLLLGISLAGRIG